MINLVASDMCQSVPGLEAALVVDEEGLLMATELLDEILRDEGINESLAGAITAKAVSGTSCVVKKLVKGIFDAMIVNTSQGVFLYRKSAMQTQNSQHVFTLLWSQIPLYQ